MEVVQRSTKIKLRSEPQLRSKLPWGAKTVSAGVESTEVVQFISIRSFVILLLQTRNIGVESTRNVIEAEVAAMEMAATRVGLALLSSTRAKPKVLRLGSLIKSQGQGLVLRLNTVSTAF